MHSTEPLAIPVAEAARLLSVSRATVFRLLAAGKLRRVDVGAVRVARASVEALLTPAPSQARRVRRTATGFQPFSRADLRALR